MAATIEGRFWSIMGAVKPAVAWCMCRVSMSWMQAYRGRGHAHASSTHLIASLHGALRRGGDEDGAFKCSKDAPDHAYDALLLSALPHFERTRGSIPCTGMDTGITGFSMTIATPDA